MLTVALLLIAAGLAWLALETRATHRAIDAYAAEMRLWTAMLRHVDETRRPFGE